MLQDKDVEVRQAVVASLADVNSVRVAAALDKALEDAVPQVSFAAASVNQPRKVSGKLGASAVGLWV